jgi:tetratricopeptide (TPR) repeat protein
MGAVYLALDAEKGGEMIALKKVHGDAAGRRQVAMLRNEFRALAPWRHPNLLRVHDFEIDRETSESFYTCEFVAGHGWEAVARDTGIDGRRRLERFLDLLVQVLRGLAFFHARGLVHGDIKPDNVLAGGVSAGGGDAGSAEDWRTTDAPLRATVIDFGLARKEGTGGGEKVFGTPYYVAPETILGGAVDRRTDLYSLGVVLYQLVTGELPFRGESNVAILRSHVDREPAPPVDLEPRLPAELGDIVLRLLRKRPEERYQDATEVIEDLNRALGFSFPLETPETTRASIDAAALAGREAERREVKSLFLAASRLESAPASGEAGSAERAGAGAGTGEAAATEAAGVRSVLVRGEKGLGKRRLIKELLRLAQVAGARLVEIECSSLRSAGQGLLGVVRELEAFAARHAEGGVPPYAHRAALIAQELRHGEEHMTPSKERALGEVALRLEEAAVASPFVIHFHDAHLAGEILTELLAQLVEHQVQGRVPDSRLFVSMTALDRGEVEGTRFQELSQSPSFRAGAREVQLERLGRSGVASLLGAAFAPGAAAGALTDMVLEESDGNLETVTDILCFLADREQITRSAAGWVVRHDYDPAEVPGKVRRELEERLRSLPEEARRLGMAFACLGQARTLEAATRLGGVPPERAAWACAELRREKVLQGGAGADWSELYSLVHSSAREMLYDMIPAGERTSWHELAGSLLEEEGAARGKIDSRSVAWHFFRAGNREKALRHGLDAARGLARELAPLEALEAYERVLSLVDGAKDPLAEDVGREMAALRFQVGDYRGALDLLESLLGRHTGPEEGAAGEAASRKRSALHLEAARASARLGDFLAAERLLARVPPPASSTSTVLERARLIFVWAELHFLRGDPVEALRCARHLSELEPELDDKVLLSEIHMLRAQSHGALGDDESAAGFCQRALRSLDSGRDRGLLASSLFCRGKSYVYRQRLDRAERQFRLSLLLRERMGAADGQADCHHELGLLHQGEGRASKACEHLEKALALYERNGNRPRALETRCRLAEAYRLLGDGGRSLETLEDALGKAEPWERPRVARRASLTFAGLSADRGNGTQAMRYIDEIRLHESRAAGSGREAVEALSLLGELSLERGEISSALEQVARGVLEARAWRDPVLLVRTLSRRALLLSRFGMQGGARRVQVELLDLAARHGLHLARAWASLIEALVLAARLNGTGDPEGTENTKGTEHATLPARVRDAFSQAGSLMAALGSERDLLALRLERGLWAITSLDHESAYLDLEEGLHLARKLGLRYEECRCLLARGILENALREGQKSRAEESFALGVDLAARHGFSELLWQHRFRLGECLAARGAAGEALAVLRLSLSGLAALMGKIPLEGRARYLQATSAGAALLSFRRLAAASE